MENKLNLEVGKEVFIISKERFCDDKEIVTKVKSIGRKYFTVESSIFSKTKFHIDSGRILSEYSIDTFVYNDRESYYHKLKIDKTLTDIRGVFYYVGARGSLTDEQILEIGKILKIEY